VRELIQSLPLRDQLRVVWILMRIRVKCLRIAKLIAGMFVSEAKGKG
jgi:hypothetical protein